MEYYSAIKKNAFESILMRWMKLELIIQSDAEYIMRKAGLEEAQAGIKIARRNINHHRYADDTTLMAESEEELKSLLMKVPRHAGFPRGEHRGSRHRFL